MPAYNFQKQFVPMIRDGLKKQTIRRRRKNRTEAGDLLRLYTGQRTKNCELIHEGVCTAVKPIQIMPVVEIVKLDGRVLDSAQVFRLAKADGFETPEAFFEFFKQYPPDVLYFGLEVIYWR